MKPVLCRVIFAACALGISVVAPQAQAEAASQGEITSRPLIEYRQAPARARLPESVVPRRYYRTSAPAMQTVTPPTIAYETPSPQRVHEAPRSERMVPAEQYDHLQPIVR